MTESQQTQMRYAWVESYAQMSKLSLNVTEITIIKCLNDSGRSMTGKEISDTVGIGPRHAWNALSTLMEKGYVSKSKPQGKSFVYKVSIK
jgi:DNA-binding MarR family transcriptional regulator